MPASIHHPKKVADLTKRAELREERRKKQEFAKLQASKYGLRFCHVRTQDTAKEADEENPRATLNPKGGCTVAFQLPKRKGDRIINVSCAIVHDNDTFCRAEGRYQAAKKFNEGSVIQVRVPRGFTPSHVIKEMFWWTA